MYIVTKKFGVEHYAFFHNAGYLGMYNKDIAQLTKMRNIPKGNLLDYMGKDELATNLFRITQTDLKIKNEGISGQKPLEVVAKSVGRTVRETMKEIGGVLPEDMPKEIPIKLVKGEIKKRVEYIKKIDAKKKKK